MIEKCFRCGRDEFHLLFNGDLHVICKQCGQEAITIADATRERGTLGAYVDINTKVLMWEG
jgi:hypothetical protein